MVKLNLKYIYELKTQYQNKLFRDSCENIKKVIDIGFNIESGYFALTTTINTKLFDVIEIIPIEYFKANYTKIEYKEIMKILDNLDNTVVKNKLQYAYDNKIKCSIFVGKQKYLEVYISFIDSFKVIIYSDIYDETALGIGKIKRVCLDGSENEALFDE